MIIYFLIYASLYSFPSSSGHFVAASRSLAPLAEPRDGAPDRRKKHFSACQFTAARGLCLAAITGADVQYWPDAIGGGAPPRNNSATDEGRPRRPRPRRRSPPPESDLVRGSCSRPLVLEAFRGRARVEALAREALWASIRALKSASACMRIQPQPPLASAPVAAPPSARAGQAIHPAAAINNKWRRASEGGHNS